MRLPRHEVEQLAELLKDDLAPDDACVRNPVPLLKRVCIAITKLASCCEYRVVGEKYGVSKSTVYRCVTAFCYAMAKHKGKFIKFPTTEEACAIADRIAESHGYIQAFGAIDGSHIAINPPADGLADYINRKMYPSIVLQGLVDDRYTFRDVSCKCPGSMHDSAVFNNSSLSTRIERQMPQRSLVIDGVAIPLHILGDPAYPLTTCIIKPYTGRNLTPEQESFNVYHSGARMMVENAFGRLKSRWRMVAKRLDCVTELSPYVIMTCCMLHNICERMKTPVHVDECFNGRENEQPPPGEHEQRIEPGANQIRDTIKNYLGRTLPLRTSSRD